MYISTKELATRWGLSHRTLEEWRADGKGPKFVHIGKKVRYSLAEVEKYEKTLGEK